MTFRMGVLSILALGALVTVPPAPAQEDLQPVGRSRPRGRAARPAELIVSMRTWADAHDTDRVLRLGGARKARASRLGRHYLVTLEPGDSVERALARYRSMPEVEFAEANGVVRYSAGATFKPNDRYYTAQWNLRMMDAERTWGIQKGAATVAVAVLDTGVAYEDYTDPVTRQAFRKAPDWGNTVFLQGYDFVNGDTHPNDDEGHGTHVASTIAEAADNNEGVAGIAFGCAILPVKILDDFGEGTFFDVAEGIDFATNFSKDGRKPVKVINLSLGSDRFSQVIASAVDRAAAAGILVVAASGNSGSGMVEFPASQSNVVAVGALDAVKQRASYSNSGSELDFVAPGGECDGRDADGDSRPDCIWQQTLDWDYVEIGRYDRFCYCGLDGTSMATPHVSAAAALLFSQGFTDPAAVRAALEQTAERLGGAPANGRNDSYGHGLVRPSRALPGMGPGTGLER